MKKDIMDVPSDSRLIEERMKVVEGLNVTEDDNVQLIRGTLCQGTPHLLDLARSVSLSGHASILLKAPASLYEKGKTSLFQRAVVFLLPLSFSFLFYMLFLLVWLLLLFLT